nr:MAG TPA: hypothetical protein [Caudoviricetes sp.]
MRSCTSKNLFLSASGFCWVVVVRFHRLFTPFKNDAVPIGLQGPIGICT